LPDYQIDLSMDPVLLFRMVEKNSFKIW